jgi:hypothetical protein
MLPIWVAIVGIGLLGFAIVHARKNAGLAALVAGIILLAYYVLERL